MGRGQILGGYSSQISLSVTGLYYIQTPNVFKLWLCCSFLPLTLIIHPKYAQIPKKGKAKDIPLNVSLECLIPI
jgi:hypothetical protein